MWVGWARSRKEQPYCSVKSQSLTWPARGVKLTRFLDPGLAPAGTVLHSVTAWPAEVRYRGYSFALS